MSKKKGGGDGPEKMDGNQEMIQKNSELVTRDMFMQSRVGVL